MYNYSEVLRDDDDDLFVPGNRHSSVPPVSGVRRRISSPPPSNDHEVRLKSSERELAMVESIVEKRGNLPVDPDPLLTQKWVIHLSGLRIHVSALKRLMEESRNTFEELPLLRLRQGQNDTHQEVTFVFDPEDELG